MKAFLVTKCGIRISVRCKAIVDVEGLRSWLEAGGYEVCRAWIRAGVLRPWTSLERYWTERAREILERGF